jgi:hypothetical protein
MHSGSGRTPTPCTGRKVRPPTSTTEPRRSNEIGPGALRPVDVGVTNFPRWASLAAVLTVLGVVAVVRFYRLDLSWFLLDHVRDVTMASAIAGGERLPLLGPRIGWMDAYLGPLYYYILSLPFLVTRDPIAGVAFVAASNVAAAYLLYGFARRYWSTPVGLAAAVLFGVFPLAVWSSRLVWHPGLMPLFTVLFIRSLFALVVDGRSMAAVPMLALLAVLTQLHLATVAFVPLALLALVMARHLDWRHVAVGAALGVLLYMPYLAYEFAHDFENARAITHWASSGGPVSLRGTGLVLVNLFGLYPWALAGFFPGEPGAGLLPVAFHRLFVTESLLFGAGILVAVGRLARAWRQGAVLGRADILLLLWLSSPLLVLRVRDTPIWWYYLDLLYPSQFIFAGIALAALPKASASSERARTVLAAVSIGVTAVLVLFQAAIVVALQRDAARRGQFVLDVTRFSINGAISPIGWFTSLPLGYRSQLVRVLRLDADEFARRVHGDVLGIPYESEYLVRYDRPSTEGHPSGRRETHYLVTRAEGDSPVAGELRVLSVGPYRVLEYRPSIDYASFSYATVAADSPPGSAAWTALGSRWPRFERDLEPTGALLLRGTLVASEPARPTVIAVRLTTWATPGTVELGIDGVSARPLSTSRQQHPFMMPEGSRWRAGLGWSVETTFDLSSSMPEGTHSILVRLTGGGRAIAVDIFERARPASG